jgi:large subunit ribosomal protein L25
LKQLISKEMENLTLKAIPRETGEKPDNVSELVPAILYGGKKKNKMLWVNRKEFQKLYEDVGESTILKLVIEGSKPEEEKVLIYDIQNHPLRGDCRHIDFYRVDMKKEIETDVELIFEGEVPAVKELGGVLVKNIDEIEVRCLPKDLPSEIKVDLGQLKTFDDTIAIRDLKLPSGVKVDLEPETVVALVSPPRTDAELEQLEETVEADVSQVEGIKEEAAEAEKGATEGEKEKRKEEPAKKEETEK